MHSIIFLLKKTATGDRNISILRLSCRTSDLNFYSSFKHMHLSCKSVYNREHEGVICNMTYKVPYITAKMIFTQSVSEMHPIMTTVNTQKMLVSLSDFPPSPSSNSSQSTRPIGRVLWEELLVLSRFHL